MILFHEALLTGGTSESFEVLSDCTVTILLTGTLAAVDFTVQISPDNVVFTDIWQEGTEANMNVTNNVYSLEVGGGCWFRIVAGAGAIDVDCWVGGKGVF